MIPFSVLDLSPIIEGKSAADAFRNTLDLARHAERWGYHRYWMAEHHNMPGIASAATAVVIAHVAGGTERIRVGSGGVMLPNHAPLVIAEQFGTLESLFPGRIDLGLGRAPGTDQRTARALRRSMTGSDDSFPQDVAELQAWFAPVQPGTARRAQCADLAAGFQPVQRATSGTDGPALCLRLAFCTGLSDAGARYLPLDLPALGRLGQALCHGGAKRLRGRDGRGGCSPHCSSSSSICAAARPVRCRRRATAWMVIGHRWSSRWSIIRWPMPWSVPPTR